MEWLRAGIAAAAATERREGLTVTPTIAEALRVASDMHGSGHIYDRLRNVGGELAFETTPLFFLFQYAYGCEPHSSAGYVEMERFVRIKELHMYHCMSDTPPH